LEAPKTYKVFFTNRRKSEEREVKKSKNHGPLQRRRFGCSWLLKAIFLDLGFSLDNLEGQF
jgi:hypothetical protein